jgi:hypothetical protein
MNPSWASAPPTPNGVVCGTSLAVRRGSQLPEAVDSAARTGGSLDDPYRAVEVVPTPVKGINPGWGSTHSGIAGQARPKERSGNSAHPGSGCREKPGWGLYDHLGSSKGAQSKRSRLSRDGC